MHIFVISIISNVGGKKIYLQGFENLAGNLKLWAKSFVKVLNFDKAYNVIC
jgi:hypothetical protein